MNAIILSAILGVVLMFSGIVFSNSNTVRNIAIGGKLILLFANLAEMKGYHFFDIDTKNLLAFTRFGLLFNSIAIGATLLYLLVSSRDIVNVGINVAEYFTLIFFVMCGI